MKKHYMQSSLHSIAYTTSLHNRCTFTGMYNNARERHWDVQKISCLN